jgi:hypothetical protein
MDALSCVSHSAKSSADSWFRPSLEEAAAGALPSRTRLPYAASPASRHVSRALSRLPCGSQQVVRGEAVVGARPRRTRMRSGVNPLDRRPCLVKQEVGLVAHPTNRLDRRTTRGFPRRNDSCELLLGALVPATVVARARCPRARRQSMGALIQRRRVLRGGGRPHGDGCRRVRAGPGGRRTRQPGRAGRSGARWGRMAAARAREDRRDSKQCEYANTP